MPSSFLTVGILALQGGFHEHANLLKQAGANLSKDLQLEIYFIRTPKELERCDALIIPGGESTTIMLLAKKGNLLQPLRAFVAERPCWGTCAGMICLSQEIYKDDAVAALAAEAAEDRAQQTGIGGVDICVVRNQYGRQLASFQHSLDFKGLRDESVPFPGVFIRAPIVHHTLSTAGSSDLEILATVPSGILPKGKIDSPQLGPDANLVAIKQGNKLVTSFHPELSSDSRIHEYFLEHLVLPSMQMRQSFTDSLDAK